MMTLHRRTVALGLATLSLLLGGCQSASKAAPPPAVHAPGNHNPALVMLPNDLADSPEDFSAWQYARLDGEFGMMNPPLESTVGIAVIRQYENIGSSNGTARDNSWTYSRSVRVRIGP